jgi:hypothetical protein
VIVAVVVLVVLALAVMRALMGVVARNERVTPTHPSVVEPTVPGLAAPELRARADDGVRAFLMPASEPEIVGKDAPATAPERSARS